LAYNLANFLRQLALPRPVRTWTQTTLREKLNKIGANIVRHAKAVKFQVAVPRELFAALLARIGRLRAAPRPGDRSARADESGVESRRVGMIRREVRGAGRGTSRGGRRGVKSGIQLVDCSESRRFSFDAGKRSLSNASSGEPGAVPNNEVRHSFGKSWLRA
jgi:hypothetical protein